MKLETLEDRTVLSAFGTTDLVKIIKPIGSSGPQNFIEINSTLFFTANDATHGVELWKSDGSVAGTSMVKDIFPGLSSGFSQVLAPSFTNVNGELFFVANDGTHGYELWKSNGTASGTVLVKDINPGAGSSFSRYSDPDLTNVNGTLFFSAISPGNGFELWKSDGTTAGTVQVADIQQGGSGSYPLSLTNVNGELFFGANDGTTGFELWKSDGSAAGTSLVTDINAGASDALGREAPPALTNVNGELFFAANDGTTGTELWKSDGSAAGTSLVKDINPGAASSLRYNSGLSLTNVNGTLFFLANDGTDGQELWKSDGTAAATSLVRNINPGAAGAVSPTADNTLTNVNGTVFFTANDGTHGYELWKSDGTSGGTSLVKDISPNGDAFLPFAGYPKPTNVNGTFFFTANDGTSGFELWKSDGSAAGTVQVKDVNPGAVGFPAPYGGNPNLTNVNGTLFFRANDGATGFELWKSNGSSAGTSLVADLNTHSGNSNPTNLTNVNGTLLFTANDGTTGRELWKSDGTGTGTSLVKDIHAGPADSISLNFDPPVNVNGTLFFTANDGSGYELWKSDGTTAGTTKVQNSTGTPALDPSNLTNVNGTLFFSALRADSGFELWKSDGTDAGTTLIKDIAPGYNNSYLQNLTNVNGTLFFVASDGTSGLELWKSDGTAANTVRVKDINPGAGGSFIRSSNPSLTNVNGTLFFLADDGTHGLELWKSNGTASGTVLVDDVNQGDAGSVSRYNSADTLTNVNGTLFFRADDGSHGYELWKSNGTAAGTVLVKDIIPGNYGSVPDNLTAVNGKLFFSARGDNGVELWQSDGTTAGTSQVKDIFAGNPSSNPSNLVNANGTLFFSANNGTTGAELWQSDGTANGTFLVKDIFPGPRGGSIGPKTAINGSVFFAADNGSDGRQLWAFNADTTPPTVSITASPAAITSSTSAHFTFSGMDTLTPENALVFETSLDNAAFATATSPQDFTNLAEGSHTFKVEAKDQAGNVSAPVSFTWTVDTTAPTATITTSPAAFSNTTSAHFAFSGEDSVTKEDALVFETSLDGAAFATANSPQDFINLAAGAHTFQVKAKDQAGNVSTVAAFSWTIDTTAPTVSITASPAAFSNSKSAHFTFSGMDSVTATEALVFQTSLDDAAFATATSPHDFTNLAEGSHTFKVEAKDQAGNVSAPVSFTWTVDTTAPAVSITAKPPAFSKSKSASFTFSGSDTVSTAAKLTLETSLDGGAFHTASSPQVFNNLAEGAHSFQVRATDQAGNSTTSSFTWTVDTTAPTVNITESPKSFTNNPSANFAFTVSDTVTAADALKSEVKLDNGDFVAASSPQAFPNLAPGKHTFRVRTTDQAGNVSAIASFSWTVDTTAPTVSITGKPLAFSKSNSATFSFAGHDDVTAANSLTFETSLDNGAFETASSPKSYDSLADGDHTFQVRAKDQAGNVSSTSSFSWKVDTTAPTVTITASPDASTDKTTASFSFIGTDNISAAKDLGFKVSLDNGPLETANSPKVYTNLAAGSHTFRVQSTDQAGNVSTQAVFSWTITSNPKNPNGTASIKGEVFLDANSNGMLDTGETGLANQTVFLDTNNNNVLDTGEKSLKTDTNGLYSFDTLAAGSYTVRQAITAGTFAQTAPSGGSFTVSLSGTDVTDQNFGGVETSPTVTVHPSANLFPAGVADPNEAYVKALYRAVLGREATGMMTTADGSQIPEWQYWTAFLAVATDPAQVRLSIAEGFWVSAEHHFLEIDGYYTTFLGRPQNGQGTPWIEQLDNGVDEYTVLTKFLNQPEYLNKFNSPASLVQGLFSALGISDTAPTLTVNGVQRNPQQELESNRVTSNQTIENFLLSDASLTRTVQSFYNAYLTRAADSGSTGLPFWVDTLRSSHSLEEVAAGILSTDEFFQKAKNGG